MQRRAAAAVNDHEPTRRGPGALARSNVTTAVGTGLSRVLGFVRVAAISKVLGQAALTDTYNVANNTPNVIYELLLGGVLTASLVPLFVEHLEDDDPDGTSAVISVSVIALAIITAIAIAAAPLVIDLLTTNVHTDQVQTREVATRLARLFLPQIFFYGLIALATALLNARRRFRGPAFAPILNNLIVIGVILSLPRFLDRPFDLGHAAATKALVNVLGIGTTIGIVATAMVLVPMLQRAGVRLEWRPDFGHPAVRRLVRMSAWTMGYVIANQIAYFSIQVLALSGDKGDVTAYINAFTFFMLPHGLLAVSLMTTFAPDLASSAHRGELGRFAAQMHLGLRALGLFVIPASVGYVVLARPLIATGLQRDQFTANDAALTARVLVAFAVGLFGFSAYLFILRGFYALKDAKTPFILNVGENAVNIILAVALHARFGVVGLAASYAIAYLASAALAYVVLSVRIGRLSTRSLVVTLGRYLVAASIMGAVLSSFADNDNVQLVAFGGLVVGAVVYGATTVALHPIDVHLRRSLRMRRGASALPSDEA